MPDKIFLGNLKGEKGEPGSGLKILGFYATFEELLSAVPNPTVGDTYGVGDSAPYDIYVYSEKNGWVNNGALAPDINEQTPNYVVATELEALSSGEKISIAFGKIKKAINELISHLGNKNNPHEVTKEQIGLSAVDNTSDKDKPISDATKDVLNKCVNVDDRMWIELVNHYGDDTRHITEEERARWNNAAGGGEPFVVTIVYDSDIGELISSNTAEEIYEAHQSGITVYAERSGELFRINVIAPDLVGFSNVVAFADNGSTRSMVGQFYIDADGTVTEYWYELAKFSSSYVGDGTTFTKEFQGSSIGSAILLYTENCLHNSLFIVSESGAFGVYNMETVGLSKNEINYRDGLLTIATDSNAVNQKGTTYKYHVL